MSNNQMVEKKLSDLGGVPTVDKVGVEERVARFQSRSIKKESKMKKYKSKNLSNSIKITKSKNT